MHVCCIHLYSLQNLSYYCILFPFFSYRRNKDDDDNELPEWQWTVRENPMKAKPAPSGVNVPIPQIPDNDQQLNEEMVTETPTLEPSSLPNGIDSEPMDHTNTTSGSPVIPSNDEIHIEQPSGASPPPPPKV